MRGTRRSPIHRILAPTVATLAVLGSIAWIGSATAVRGLASGTGLTRVAHIALPASYQSPDATYLAIDPGLRRAVLSLGNDGAGGAPSAVKFFDLDHLGQVTTIGGEQGVHRQHAVDATRHRLFVGDQNGGVSIYDEVAQKRVTSYAIPSVFTGDFTWGMAYAPHSNILYLVTAQAHQFTIAALDADSGQELWQQSISQCSQGVAVTTQQAVGVSLDERSLYTICNLQAAYIGGLGGIQGGGAIVSLQLPADPRNIPGCAATALGPCAYNGPFDLSAGIVTGDSGSDSLWVPGTPARPIERMVTFTPAHGGWASYVFDTQTRHFVGAPTLYQPAANTDVFYGVLGFGVDPASGRVFTQAEQKRAYRQSNGTVCDDLVPGGNSFQVAESAELGNASFNVPIQDTGLSSQTEMGYDPVGHNVWMLDNPPPPGNCNANLGSKSWFVDVYHVDLPPAQAGDAGDPDLATTNMPEAPGVTGANVGAAASAFGVRYELAPGGVEAPLTSVSAGSNGTLTCTPSTLYTPLISAATFVPLPAFANPPEPPQYTAFCHAGNREATFAHVPTVSLDAAEVRAQAVAGDTDAASAQDLETASNFAGPGPTVDSNVGYVLNSAGQPDPQQCMVPDPNNQGQYVDRCAAPSQVAPYVSGQALPYRPASCDDSGANPGSNSADNSVKVGQPPPPSPSGSPSSALTLPASAPGSALASCTFSASTQQASGESASNQASLGLPISVHDTTSSAGVKRTSTDGTIAWAKSIVNGINIGNLVEIGRLEVTASASAHGRPKTTDVNYDCEVFGLTLANIPGSPVQSPSPSTSQFKNPMTCADAQGYVDQLMLNSTLTGRVSIVFPKAYNDVKHAPLGSYGLVQERTPGGYLAQVQKSQLDQIQDSILTSDQNVEQPGLVVTMVLDTTQERNRLMASFGGVATNATYGIYSLNQDFGSGGGDGSLGGPDGSNGPLGLLSTPPGPTSLNSPAPLGKTKTGPGSNPNGIGAVAQAVVDGFRFLFQHPSLIPALMAVWLLFAAPGYLLARRRTLLLTTGGA